MKLLTTLKRFFAEPDTTTTTTTTTTTEAERLRLALKERTELHAEQLRESNANWRAQLEELINKQCDERREWAREKRELIAQLTACKHQHGLCLAEVASGQRESTDV